MQPANQGIDPEITRMFRKIINTVGIIVLWSAVSFSIPLYIGADYKSLSPLLVTGYFILVLITTIIMFFMIRKIWKAKH